MNRQGRDLGALCFSSWLDSCTRCTGSPTRSASREFYEALGLEFRRELPIVRDGELEATNYFFAAPGQEEELELTFNHDGRTYDARHRVRPHRARSRRPRGDPRAARGPGDRARARRRTGSARAARSSASSATRTTTGSS